MLGKRYAQQRVDCEPALSKDKLDALRRMAEVPGVGDVSRPTETLQASLKAAMDTKTQHGARPRAGKLRCNPVANRKYVG